MEPRSGGESRAKQPRIRVGIAGFGLSGRFFHGTLLKSHLGFEVIKIMTSRKEEAASFFPEAETVPDFSSLLNDPKIDLVVNCVPNLLHFEYTARALEAGKNVVVEKPF